MGFIKPFFLLEYVLEVFHKKRFMRKGFQLIKCHVIVSGIIILIIVSVLVFLSF